MDCGDENEDNEAVRQRSTGNNVVWSGNMRMEKAITDGEYY